MLTISKRLTEKRTADLQLVLPFEQRSKSRLRAVLDNAEEAGLFLERGSILRGGDLLQADDGRVVEIVAAPETVSKATSGDPQTLLRASYHLGNRHVALQIGPGWLRYQHDHVLDEMVQGLGLSVRVEQASFEPEAGAYDAGSHSHEQDHDHDSSEASVDHNHPHHRHD